MGVGVYTKHFLIAKEDISLDPNSCYGRANEGAKIRTDVNTAYGRVD